MDPTLTPQLKEYDRDNMPVRGRGEQMVQMLSQETTADGHLHAPLQ